MNSMIYITRPVVKTHKTVPKTTDKSLGNNLQGRNSPPVKSKYIFKAGALENAVEDTNHIIFRDNNRFEFRIHERTGRIMVKLIDNETDEIVKEIPPEKILDLVANIWDLVGILVDERG